MIFNFLNRVETGIKSSIVELNNKEIDTIVAELNDTHYSLVIERAEPKGYEVSLVIPIDDDPSGNLYFDFIQTYTADTEKDIIKKINILCDDIAYFGKEIEIIAVNLTRRLGNLNGFELEVKNERGLIIKAMNESFLVMLETDFIHNTSYIVRNESMMWAKLEKVSDIEKHIRTLLGVN